MRFTATNRAQRGKLALAAGALALSLATLTGCGYINSQQTAEQYAASDGVHADLGPLQLRNMLIVSGDEEGPGRLIGAIYNSASQDVTLTVKGAEGARTEVPVKANSYTLLNDASDEAILSTSGGIAGSLVDVEVSEDGTNVKKTVSLPVLDGTLEEYKEYLPAGSEPTSTGSATPTPTATSGGGGH